jgi:hypothetical protein
MKKGFLFGLGVLLAGGVLAATISTITIDNAKTPGGTVTNAEFNSIATGIVNLTSTFNGAVSDETSITLTKALAVPELCISADCKTAWPTAGSGVTAKDCPAGQQLQSVNTDGVFTCGEDQTGEAGLGDNLGDYVVLQDLLPEMTGATPLMGNPPGSPSVVSTRNIGSATQWFSNLWVEDLHVGNQSLYMNGVQVLKSDPSEMMTFQADGSQRMTVQTVGDGGAMAVKSGDNLSLEITEDAVDDKVLTITNNSTNGMIDISTLVGATSSSKISVNSNSILLGSQPFSKVGVNLLTGTTPSYTLDVAGDINFTGTLYENGVAFSGGTGGSTSPWAAVTGGIAYKDGLVGIGVTTPVTSLDVSGGKVLAEKFCINTPATTDVCSSKACAGSLESGENGSTCFTQATLTAIESALSSPEGSSVWAATSFGDGIYANVTGNVGIGTNVPSAKLNVYNGDVKISRPTGSTLGNLTVAGSIQVGGNICPNPWATCTKPGEIAACGAGGGILACAGTDSKWMPITSHNGTVVGATNDGCTVVDGQPPAAVGTMRFVNGTTTQTLQICMKLSGSSTYSWRTIMSGGGAST